MTKNKRLQFENPIKISLADCQLSPEEKALIADNFDKVTCEYHYHREGDIFTQGRRMFVSSGASIGHVTIDVHPSHRAMPLLDGTSNEPVFRFQGMDVDVLVPELGDEDVGILIFPTEYLLDTSHKLERFDQPIAFVIPFVCDGKDPHCENLSTMVRQAATLRYLINWGQEDVMSSRLREESHLLDQLWHNIENLRAMLVQSSTVGKPKVSESKPSADKVDPIATGIAILNRYFPAAPVDSTYEGCFVFAGEYKPEVMSDEDIATLIRLGWQKGLDVNNHGDMSIRHVVDGYCGGSDSKRWMFYRTDL